MSKPAGPPSTVATSSGPCDSPAVRNRSIGLCRLPRVFVRAGLHHPIQPDWTRPRKRWIDRAKPGLGGLAARRIARAGGKLRARGGVGGGADRVRRRANVVIGGAPRGCKPLPYSIRGALDGLV